MDANLYEEGYSKMHWFDLHVIQLPHQDPRRQVV